MAWIYLGCSAIGLLVGLVFSLMYLNTSTSWTKILSAILSIGTPSISIKILYDRVNLKDVSSIFASIAFLILTSVITFIVIMVITSSIMKKNGYNFINILDIFLGQKKHIDNYYKIKLTSLDDELNIPKLQEREQNIKDKESALEFQKEFLRQERKAVEALSDRKLKILLPEKSKMVVTMDFLELIPSFMENMVMYINNVKSLTDDFINSYDDISIKELKAFLLQLSTQMLEDLFGGRTNDVRVHFRRYNKNKDGYEKLICVIQNKEYEREMTFIPYDKNNMIQKSSECRRSLIKSYNMDYDYPGNNSTVWKEYITFSFYNVKTNNIPCISFGISVKNIVRYKQLFCFLNYCQFEECLRDAIERIDGKYNIKNILYNEV